VEGDFGELINWVSFEEKKRLKSLYTDVRDVYWLEGRGYLKRKIVSCTCTCSWQ
jgi:hypothetical protein